MKKVISLLSIVFFSTVILPGVAKASVENTRYIERSVNLAISVDEVRQSVKAILAMVDGRNGYVVSSDVTKVRSNRSYNQAYIRLRLKASRLPLVMTKLKGLAERLNSESQYGYDKTQQYIDTQSEIAIKTQQAAYLKTIMRQAYKASDVFKAFNRLVLWRQGIDRLQARANYIKQSANLALVTISVSPSKIKQIVHGRQETIGDVAYKAFQALMTYVNQLLKSATFFMVYSLPLGLIYLICALFACWLLRLVWRRF